MASGHIEKRVAPDGTILWRVVVTDGHGRGARKVTRTIKRQRNTKNPPHEATALLEHMKREADAGVLISPRMTVREVLTRWLSEHCEPRLAPKTTYTYRRVIETHVIPALGNRRAADLRPTHISKYYAEKRAAGMSDSAIHYHYRTLHSALAWAVQMQLVGQNAAERAKPPRAKPPEMQTISPAHMLGVLEAARGTDLELPVLLAISTGARRGEVMALRWGDFDLSAEEDGGEPVYSGKVTISRAVTNAPGHRGAEKPTKTERQRTVELPPFAVKALLEAKRDRICAPDEYVVTLRDPDRVTRQWRALADSLELPEGLRLHDLRHSYATAMLESGAGLHEIQDALGHTTATTTMNTYLHVTERLRERRRETLERAFSVTPERLGSDESADVVQLEKRETA
jgi:integrase